MTVSLFTHLKVGLLLLSLVLCYSTVFVSAVDVVHRGYVVLDAQRHAHVVEMDAPPARSAATVVLTKSLSSVGWNVLNVTTNASFSDMDQAYAAGFGEGAMTYLETWQNYQNTYGPICGPGICPMFANISVYVLANMKWLESQVALYNSTSNYWKQVGLQLQQFMGFSDGLNFAAPKNQSFSFMMAWSMMALAEVQDIVTVYGGGSLEQDWRSMSKFEFTAWFVKKTHCSALIKLAFDQSDIFFGHATWAMLSQMHRMYKHYQLNYVSAAVQQVSFSSYPGTIVSVDDFYVTGAGLGVTETTFAIFNQSIYTGNVPIQSVPYWVRVGVANRLATDAPTWGSVFLRHNSGTYNNQWMILDFKLFTPKSDLVPNTLWIAEQLPGMVGQFDATSTLQYGYWPSYNIPSITALFNYAGYPEAVKTQGPEMNDYQNCVRAQIFRRDQGNIFDMPGFMYEMQYNNYLYDSVSEFNPTYTIAARGDLYSSSPQCFAAIDAKVLSWSMYASGREVMAYSGPTPQQPIFQFSTYNGSKQYCPSLGLPDRWDFQWQHFKPKP